MITSINMNRASCIVHRAPQKPCISLALTTFNGAMYLREQLDSIYAQTLLPYEVIVCDDGSTDETPAILDEYAQRYGLIWHTNPTPLGINRNFIQAIRLCHGDYVALSDQDDVWLPHKLEQTYRQLTLLPNGPAVVSTQATDVDADLQPFSSLRRYPVNQRLSSSILMNTCSQGCTLMMNRAFVDMFVALVETHPEVTDLTVYDALIGIVAASVGTKYNLQESTLLYRHHSSNAMGQVHHHTQRELITLRPRLHYTLPDDRLACLEVLYPLLREHITCPQVHRLYSEAQRINTSSCLIMSLWRLLCMHDVPLRHKLRIITFSLCNSLLRYICLHHQTT